MINKESITQEWLKSVLHYDELTGLFTWLNPTSARVRIGSVAGGINTRGYCQLGLKGYKYLAHRLVWLYIYGGFPPNVIDHINGNKFDNRLSNLREATQSQNLKNSCRPVTNTSGLKGVSWSKLHNKWEAYAWNNSKKKHLGLYLSKTEASEVYNNYCKGQHGEFYRDTSVAQQLKAEGWEIDDSHVKLYTLANASIISPVFNKELIVSFLHLDGAYSLCKMFGTDDIVHLSAWTDVFVWRKKLGNKD